MERRVTFLTTSGVAARCGVTKATVYKWYRRGILIPSFTKNGVRYFAPRYIRRFLRRDAQYKERVRKKHSICIKQPTLASSPA